MKLAIKVTRLEMELTRMYERRREEAWAMGFPLLEVRARRRKGERLSDCDSRLGRG